MFTNVNSIIQEKCKKFTLIPNSARLDEWFKYFFIVKKANYIMVFWLMERGLKRGKLFTEPMLILVTLTLN